MELTKMSLKMLQSATKKLVKLKKNLVTKIKCQLLKFNKYN